MFQYLRDKNAPAVQPGKPVDWHQRVLDLWIEDDATRFCEGHEGPEAAFLRITGQKPSPRVGYYDEDGKSDYFMNLYEGGWVITYTCEGGRVGVVVRVAPDGMGC